MEDKHIINILEKAKFKDLSQADLAMIEIHAADCNDCRREYEAAKISQIVMRTRAAQTLEPSPFFEAKVINAWRERQTALHSAANKLWQMWQDSKILFSSLAASVAVLAVLTFAVPQKEDDMRLQASNNDYYSAESIVFDQEESSDDFSDDELIQEIYSADTLEN